jgi:DNA topoisomerase-1
VSGNVVTVREGRFGPYVTDGTDNASLRVGDSVEAVTLERAAELLQARRERGPAKPRKTTKASKTTKTTKTAKKAPARARAARPKS